MSPLFSCPLDEANICHIEIGTYMHMDIRSTIYSCDMSGTGKKRTELFLGKVKQLQF